MKLPRFFTDYWYPDDETRRKWLLAFARWTGVTCMVGALVVLFVAPIGLFAGSVQGMRSLILHVQPSESTVDTAIAKLQLFELMYPFHWMMTILGTGCVLIAASCRSGCWRVFGSVAGFFAFALVLFTIVKTNEAAKLLLDTFAARIPEAIVYSTKKRIFYELAWQFGLSGGAFAAAINITTNLNQKST